MEWADGRIVIRAGGKDLPFPMALDGAGPIPRELGGKEPYYGATTAAYGVSFYPTNLLIDRNGTLVTRLDKRNVRWDVETALGVKPDGERPEDP